jgi:hypothetical protein
MFMGIKVYSGANPPLISEKFYHPENIRIRSCLKKGLNFPY